MSVGCGNGPGCCTGCAKVCINSAVSIKTGNKQRAAGAAGDQELTIRLRRCGEDGIADIENAIGVEAVIKCAVAVEPDHGSFTDRND